MDQIHSASTTRLRARDHNQVLHQVHPHTLLLPPRYDVPHPTSGEPVPCASPRAVLETRQSFCPCGQWSPLRRRAVGETYAGILQSTTRLRTYTLSRILLGRPKTRMVLQRSNVQA